MLPGTGFSAIFSSFFSPEKTNVRRPADDDDAMTTADRDDGRWRDNDELRSAGVTCHTWRKKIVVRGGLSRSRERRRANGGGRRRANAYGGGPALNTAEADCRLKASKGHDGGTAASAPALLLLRPPPPAAPTLPTPAANAPSRPAL